MKYLSILRKKYFCKACLEFDMPQLLNFPATLHIFRLLFKKFRQHGQVGQHKSGEKSIKGRRKFFVAQLDHFAGNFSTATGKYKGLSENLKVNGDTYQTPYKPYKNIFSSKFINIL